MNYFNVLCFIGYLVTINKKKKIYIYIYCKIFLYNLTNLLYNLTNSILLQSAETISRDGTLSFIFLLQMFYNLSLRNKSIILLINISM